MPGELSERYEFRCVILLTEASIDSCKRTFASGFGSLLSFKVPSSFCALLSILSVLQPLESCFSLGAQHFFEALSFLVSFLQQDCLLSTVCFLHKQLLMSCPKDTRLNDNSNKTTVNVLALQYFLINNFTYTKMTKIFVIVKQDIILLFN